MNNSKNKKTESSYKLIAVRQTNFPSFSLAFSRATLFSQTPTSVSGNVCYILCYILWHSFSSTFTSLNVLIFYEIEVNKFVVW